MRMKNSQRHYADDKMPMRENELKMFPENLIKEIEIMYSVFLWSDQYKHEWKFGRTKNAVGTRAAGECSHSFFEFSQTFTSVCITR